jgi:hypothetical protein
VLLMETFLDLSCAFIPKKATKKTAKIDICFIVLNFKN